MQCKNWRLWRVSLAVPAFRRYAYDWRVLHRGRANHGEQMRIVVSLVFANSSADEAHFRGNYAD